MTHSVWFSIREISFLKEKYDRIDFATQMTFKVWFSIPQPGYDTNCHGTELCVRILYFAME